MYHAIGNLLALICERPSVIDLRICYDVLAVGASTTIHAFTCTSTLSHHVTLQQQIWYIGKHTKENSTNN